MKANTYWLFTIVMFLAGMSRAHAQDPPAYDHNIIAILPFKTGASIQVTSDSVMQRYYQYLREKGVELQEAFYKAVTKDQDKLLVEVQDWRVTDSLLKAAGFDYRKVTYANAQTLARLLKVDGLLIGEFYSFQYNRAFGQTKDHYSKTITVYFVDGRSGNTIWKFNNEQEYKASKRGKGEELSTREIQIEEKMFQTFCRRFPYTR